MLKLINGIWQIIEGDCLEELPKLADAGVQFSAAFADPSYSTPVITGFGRVNVRNVADLSVQETYMKLFRQSLEAALKPNAPVFIFCDDDYYPSIFRAFYSWPSTQLVVWNKGRIGMGRPFRSAHELLFYANRETVDYNRTDGITHYSSVQNYAPVPKAERLHPAQKPVALIADLLLGFTNEGDLILDPFAGSGSTGEACILTKRRFVGIDLNGETCGTARARLTRAEGNPAELKKLYQKSAPAPLFEQPLTEHA